MEIHDQIRSPIELLPVEMWQSILLFLPDLRSLANTALSCRTAYSTFAENKRRVIRQVLANHIGVDVLPEAVLVWKCTPPVLSTPVEPKLSKVQSKELHDFAIDFLDQLVWPPLSSVPWDWRTALALCKFHSCITDLSERFIQSCAETTHVELGKSLNTRPPSTAERARIARAFYRFELFRKLIGCQGILNAAVSAGEFFTKHAPWENAQLACVHDFLAWQVIPTFDEVAKHDVVWGEYRVDFSNSPASAHTQHVLSLGLEELYHVITARSWEHKRNALCAGEMPPGINLCFLHDPLENLRGEAAAIVSGDGIDDEDLQMMGDQPPLCDDGDRGPEKIWKLSREQSAVAYYEEEHWIHRRWGYVMWDQARLQALRILEKPLLKSEEPEPGTEMPPLETMQKSWDARAAIYERGGRGWWKENDETRLSWPEPLQDSTGPGPSVQKVPTSLAEAKALWRSGYDELKTNGL